MENNPIAQQAQSIANKVMSMNRHRRREFAKKNGTPKIAGSNKPYVKANQTREKVR